MTRRSAIKPAYPPTEPKKPETFAQKHKYMVVAIRPATHYKPARTITLRFSDAVCADNSVAWYTEKGYFTRIV